MYPSAFSSNLTSSSHAGFVYLDPTFSTPLSMFDENTTLNQTYSSSIIITDQNVFKSSNLSCDQIKQEYVYKKTLFNIVRYMSQNLNRFFILPALILNLCAFYILRRTRMNRSSSIAFYMQALALCDVAFFALRVLFGELASSQAGRQILSDSLCKFLFLMVNAVNYTTGKRCFLLFFFFSNKQK